MPGPIELKVLEPHLHSVINRMIGNLSIPGITRPMDVAVFVEPFN